MVEAKLKVSSKKVSVDPAKAKKVADAGTK